MGRQPKINAWFHKGSGKKFFLKEGLCAFLSIDDYEFQKMVMKGEIVELFKSKKTNSKKPVTVEYNGVIYNSYVELCNAFNIPHSTLTRRLRNGLTVEQAIEKGVKKCQSKK